MEKVFVYGTLMRQSSNHRHYLEESIFLGIGLIQGYALYDLGSYPGIIPLENENTKGDVFEVDDSTMERLDKLEGEVFLYTRELVKVRLHNEVVEEAWVYIWNGSVSTKIKLDFEQQPWERSVWRNEI